ncbi:SRPBCC domain-containing protein [Fulvivirgaceae bacterium BMA10]|uniref:SRPBCC domain-containing protein n=1 Tax=Splendidivirga corallicola TaxID=3051826 RepID=A0ABT8KMG1_9BACT|nr:SRPBCC domain-containing protein [Fulvivirgaceae bacterium BMA10]
MEKDNYLYKEIWIKASVQQVFACFTEEEAMLTWHGKEVTLDPVPGGIYRVVFENGDVILGKFKEVLPNEKLVYTARYNDVDSVVTVNFVGENGGTKVSLKQEFKPDQDISTFQYGWDYFLGLLKKRWEQ